MTNESKEQVFDMLSIMKADSFMMGNLKIKFARVDEHDIEWIESLSDSELLNVWLSHVINEEEGSCSIRDIQFTSVCELEISDRKLLSQAQELYYAWEERDKNDYLLED